MNNEYRKIYEEVSQLQKAMLLQFQKDIEVNIDSLENALKELKECKSKVEGLIEDLHYEAL